VLREKGRTWQDDLPLGGCDSRGVILQHLLAAAAAPAAAEAAVATPPAAAVRPQGIEATSRALKNLQRAVSRSCSNTMRSCFVLQALSAGM
jgi:hypothetical protein